MQRFRLYILLVLSGFQWILSAWSCTPDPVSAGHFAVADVFGNHMVLQRNKPIFIWGRAFPRTEVEVQLEQDKQTVKADPEGNWSVRFPARSASVEPLSLSVSNLDSALVFSDILVGDVWFFSGQSNMDFILKDANNGVAFASKNAGNLSVRLLEFNPVAGTNNQAWDSATIAKVQDSDFFSARWKPNNFENAAGFSAIAYAFGIEIQEATKVPVGLIEMAVGGSPQVSWMSRESLKAFPGFGFLDENWINNPNLMAWCRERAAVNLANGTARNPKHPFAPSYNCEAGLMRLLPFPIRGMVWYQGESDAENQDVYEQLFPAFVHDLRQKWNDDFPFYYVQLSSIDRSTWPEFRDLQRRMLQIIPNSAMAVSTDLGDSTDVHPREKLPVGYRLARLAMSNDYGMEIVPSGPLFDRISQDTNGIRVYLKYSEGLSTRDGEQLKGFGFLDDNGKLLQTEAYIAGNHVVVRIPASVKPRFLVYGWEPFTRANLQNGAGLPASTFRIKLSE